MPSPEDGKVLLLVNSARCKAREAELLAVKAFQDAEGLPARLDLLRALNRLSSFLYLIMIQLKKPSPRGLNVRWRKAPYGQLAPGWKVARCKP